MLRCLWDRGVKGGSNEDSNLLVCLDKLLIWVIITIRCLCFDENRFMGSMKEHPENGHFSLFGPRVWTLFRSKIFFVMKMKTKKIISIRNLSCFSTRWVWSKNPIVLWIKIEETDLSCFPFIFDWDPFTSRKRLHPVRHSLLKSLLIIK